MSTPDLERDVELILRILWGRDSAIRPRVGDHDSRDLVKYALFPRTDKVRALVPVWPPSVTAAVVRNYITPTSPSQRIRAASIRLAARLGILSTWPHSVRVRGASSGTGLLDYLAEKHSQDLRAGIYLGPPRVNRKPVVQVLTTSGDPVAYVKIGINEFTNQRLDNEAAALAALNRAQLQTVTVPELRFSGRWGDHSFLVLGPVRTRTDRDADPEAMRSAMAELSRSFGVEHSPLKVGAWWKQMERGLTELVTPDAACLRALAAQVDEHCGDQELELGTAHGDWSPWNTATVNGGVVLWDWERFRRGVPIGWDAFHFEAQSTRQPNARGGAGLHRLIPSASTITQGTGSAFNDPLLVLTTYLLDLGQRYLQDGQATGVEPRGPITEWLLGPLTAAVQLLKGRVSR